MIVTVGLCAVAHFSEYFLAWRTVWSMNRLSPQPRKSHAKGDNRLAEFLFDQKEPLHPLAVKNLAGVEVAL
jgi:hypothetical protein